MHRIDGAGATVDNKFTRGSPSQGLPATTVTDDWCNDVQEEIVSIILGEGIALEKGTQNQLYSAIKSMITSVFGKVLKLNRGGNATSGGDAGIEINENGVVTGYARTSTDRNRWRLKAPNLAGMFDFEGSAGAFFARFVSIATEDRTYILPDASMIFAGLEVAQTFTARQTFGGLFNWSKQTDATATGANAALATPTKTVLELTNASLTSIDTIPAGTASQALILVNRTGNSLTLNNDTGATAANRILTGTAGPVVMTNRSSMNLRYDTTEARWMIVGGTGSGGNWNVAATSTVPANGTIAISTVLGLQVIPVGSAIGAPVTANPVPFGTSAPSNGAAIILVGTDSTNTVTLTSNDAAKGCIINGDAVLGKGSTIKLMYLSSLDRYIEISRNMVGGY